MDTIEPTNTAASASELCSLENLTVCIISLLLSFFFDVSGLQELYFGYIKVITNSEPLLMPLEDTLEHRSYLICYSILTCFFGLQIVQLHNVILQNGPNLDQALIELLRRVKNGTFSSSIFSFKIE